MATQWLKDTNGNKASTRDPANMTRRETIIDIQSGELRDVIQILECNPCEGICHDVTGDILAEAAAPYVSMEAFRQAAE